MADNDKRDAGKPTSGNPLYDIKFPALPADMLSATYKFTKSDFYTTQGYTTFSTKHLGDFVKIRRIVNDTKREVFVYVRAILVDPVTGEQIPYLHVVNAEGKISPEARALKMSTIDSLYSRANRGTGKRESASDTMLSESDLFA